MGEWRIVASDLFIKQLKKYSRNTKVRKKLNEMLKLLQQAYDPRRIGDRKAGQLKDVYAAKLSRSIRLVYKVFNDRREIQLIGIGDHKQVYGHD